MKRVRKTLFRIGFIVLACQVSTAFGQVKPMSQEILQTVFPEARATNLSTATRIRIDQKRWIDVQGSVSAVGCSIATRNPNSSVLFVAYAVTEEDDHWNSSVVYALVRREGGKYVLLNKTTIQDRERGYFAVGGAKVLRLQGRQMILLEYSNGDSISTPRGWHTISKLIDVSTVNAPVEVWSVENRYEYGGASQQQTKRVVEFTLKDVNNDGYEEIHTTTTTVEEDVFVWNHSRFVKPKSYPPEPVKAEKE